MIAPFKSPHFFNLCFSVQPPVVFFSLAFMNYVNVCEWSLMRKNCLYQYVVHQWVGKWLFFLTIDWSAKDLAEWNDAVIRSFNWNACLILTHNLLSDTLNWSGDLNRLVRHRHRVVYELEYTEWQLSLFNQFNVPVDLFINHQTICCSRIFLIHFQLNPFFRWSLML